MKEQIGDKIVEVKNGVIHATAEEIPREDGGVDVVVHVPCLQLTAKKE